MRAEQRGKSKGEFEGENVRRCERRESGKEGRWEGGKVGRWESMKVKSWGGGGRVRNGVG